MKRILLYGFGAFQNFSRNPSQLLVTQLAQQKFKSAKIEKIIFPVSYSKVEERICRLLHKESYDAIVGFGLAAGSVGIRLEKYARNAISSAQADIKGYRPHKKSIVKEGKDFYRSTLPLNRYRDSLIKEDIPTVVSTDAGGYVCNFSYYLFMNTIRLNRLKTQCVFVHIPLTSAMAARMSKPQPSLPESLLVEGGAHLIRQIIKEN